MCQSGDTGTDWVRLRLQVDFSLKTTPTLPFWPQDLSSPPQRVPVGALVFPVPPFPTEVLQIVVSLSFLPRNGKTGLQIDLQQSQRAPRGQATGHHPAVVRGITQVHRSRAPALDWRKDDVWATLPYLPACLNLRTGVRCTLSTQVRNYSPLDRRF